jgi:hypothetical protein
MRNNNNRTRIFVSVNIFIIISVLLFIVSCGNDRDLNFTFNNKTSSEIDSVQVIINDGCPQCPQIETTGKIPPYESVKLTVIPYDDITADGDVSLMLFKDSLKKQIYSAGPGYFTAGRLTGPKFNDDRLQFSIIETDTGLSIINDYKERNRSK